MRTQWQSSWQSSVCVKLKVVMTMKMLVYPKYRNQKSRRRAVGKVKMMITKISLDQPRVLIKLKVASMILMKIMRKPLSLPDSVAKMLEKQRKPQLLLLYQLKKTTKRAVTDVVVILTTKIMHLLKKLTREQMIYLH